MDTFVDLEAQVLKDGRPFTRPTRWSYGLGSFGDSPEPAHWRLRPGAANLDGYEVVIYVQHMGWMYNTIEGDDAYASKQWCLIRAQLSVDGVLWPQALPGQLWVPPDKVSDMLVWTCVIHFDWLADVTHHLAGVHSLLLRAIRGEKEAGE